MSDDRRATPAPTRMPGAIGAAAARVWTRVYTAGVPVEDRVRRRAEVDAFLWDQRCALRTAQRRGVPAAWSIAAATVRGALDDLAWRREHVRHLRRTGKSSLPVRGSFMDKLLQDVATTIRTVVRNPGFAATAILTLALGIGANVAIFSLTNTVLVKSMPYPDAEELVGLWETNPERGFNQISISPLNYVDWREQQTVFTDIGVLRQGSLTLLGDGEPERVEGARASAALFEVVGVPPALGRLYSEAEDRPGGENVALIGDALWKSRYGSRTDIVGTPINVDGVVHVVVGVMPPEFNFPFQEQMWVPLKLDVAEESRASRNLDAIARLRDGVSLERAYAEMTGITAQLAEAYPESNEGFGIFIEGLREQEIGDERILVYVLSGVVGFVLLIACANVANLTLARASSRRQEIAVRAALGAGRGRLMRQLLTESIVLAAIGGVLGLVVGIGGKNLIVAAFPDNVPTWMNWDFDAAVYVYLAVITLLTGLLFGFVPALHASRGRLGAAPGSQARVAGGRARSLFRGTLVVAEVALAMILLVGAGLMVRAYMNLNAVDPGFDPDDLLTLRLSLPAGEYGEAERQIAFYDELLDRIRGLPGVDSAAATTLVPVGSFSGTYLGIEGHDAGENETLPIVTYAEVTPGYVETMAIPLLEGRTFRDGDGAEGTPEVLLVSRTAAERFWLEESPIGKRVKFGATADPESEFKTVIGVVGDVMQTGIGDPFFPAVYVPVAQSPERSMAIVVRAAGGATAVLASIRDEVRQIDADLPIYGILTMAERIAQDDWEEKLFTRIFATFAVIALVLASVGLYGVVSYSVARRTREIGVRMALGADRTNLVRMVVRQGIRLTAIGLAIGLLGAWAVTRVIESLLIGVSPTDPLTFGTIIVVLASVAAMASYLPARRATRVDPVKALR